MENFFTFLVAALLPAVLLLVGAHSIVNSSTSSKCLERGYAEYKVDWKFKSYCVKRDYQGSMYAIPLQEAETLAKVRPPAP